jgi:hypothetical protein
MNISSGDITFIDGRLLRRARSFDVISLTQEIINLQQYGSVSVFKSTNSLDTSIRTIVDTSDLNIYPSNGIVEVKLASPQAVTLVLPLSPKINEMHTISDGSDTADSYNISVFGNGKMIGTYSTYPIKTKSESITMYYNGVSWRLI